MQKSTFRCSRGKYTIRGTLFRPEGDALPIAIVSHAFLQNQRSTRHYARALAEMGYAAFCFDFVGGSVLNKSSGWLREMTVFTEVEDLKAVIAYAKAQPFTNPRCVTLMGCSQGGFVSALTAVELQQEIEKLVLLYPALCIPEDARKGQMLFFSFDPKNVPPLIRGKGHLMNLRGEYATTVMDMDAYGAIAPYRGPVLLVYGDEDEVVPGRCFRKAYDAYLAAGNKIQVLKLPNARHGFNEEEDAQVIPVIRSFLREKAEVQP